jgi:hypothetical protein
MKRCAALATLVLAGLAWAEADKDDIKDVLKSKAPSEWKSEEPSNNLRYMQFRVPKVEGDKEDAELVIFRNLGGTNKDNIERWKKTFVPPEGKKIDDIAKESKVKIGDKEAVVLQIEGTYRYRPPGDPNAKEELKANYKFYGVIVETKDSVFHIKFSGPEKTVEKYEKGFMDWLQAFK